MSPLRTRRPCGLSPSVQALEAGVLLLLWGCSLGAGEARLNEMWIHPTAGAQTVRTDFWGERFARGLEEPSVGPQLAAQVSEQVNGSVPHAQELHWPSPAGTEVLKSSAVFLPVALYGRTGINWDECCLV